MIRPFIKKLLGIEAMSIVIPDVIVPDVTLMVQDPCSRYIEQSSAEDHFVFGRNCLPGELIRNAAATPETAAMQYCRN